ncbi:hypothetical protein EHI96_20065 [Cronobacter malonaticus]|uniref:hypothetical protein n=1 Tax=Cronobacter malonaticus TaxID=413503 RepID=UPI0013764814|nr:hypothetical protein [Cronobacter malonaticus]NCI02116.1 hypothetical protein [Cronobacter malonaticus]
MEEIKELLKKARTNAECGEHLSPPATIKLIDDVEHYLEKHETDDATNRHLYFYSAQTIDGNIFSGGGTANLAHNQLRRAPEL